MPNDQEDWTSVFARPQTQLVGSPATYAAGDTSKTFTLAPDTSVVCVLVPNFQFVIELQIKGVTSGFTYVKEFPDLTSYHPYYTAVINSAVDSQVIVEINTSNTVTAYVSSIPDPVATLMLPNQQAPWQAPNQPPITIDFDNPGAGNRAIIIASPANSESIYLHGMQWVWTAAAATANGQWTDGGGGVHGADSPITAGIPRFMDWKGAKLPGGHSFDFTQVGAAAIGTTHCYGILTYAIY